MNLRQAAVAALEALEITSSEYCQGCWLEVIAALKEALAQLDRKCEAGPSLQDLWDCWDAAHGGQTPVAYRYKDSRAHYRYVGNRPNMDTSSYTILKLDPLYLHPAPIPEGWQLVPKEPTENMIKLGAYAERYSGVYGIYKDMLAAAPKPEEMK
jgi:hypothetical protein